ncbi:thiamine-phosphate kinase [Qipengyuania sp. DSG2-2]|uniref:thiamine-phosphate kinase n=1 Tax=Qipengyuania sp. DGS2-2 TaxID=3349631 RepID=UPI0036D22FD9
MNELDFIQSFRALAPHPAARGLVDDAAVLEVGDETLVLTHDAMVEGRHWLPSQDMADVAWKLVATNLSDLAAKGAEPLGVLLGHTLGDGDERFVAGLRAALTAFNCPLLGGDTVSAGDGARTLGLTAIGRATHTPVPSRSTAQPGDTLFLTGPVGAAMMGFEALRDDTGEASTAFRCPAPLLAEGQALAPLVSAMMDVSDGLLLDSWRMATASGLTLVIASDDVPIDAPEDRRADALRWGDDYQLLFTAPLSAKLPVPAVPVGTVEEGEVPLILDGLPITGREGLGYTH